MVTATIPSKSAQNIAIDDTPPALVSPYSYYKCHEASGDTLTDSAPVDKQLFGDLVLSSSTGSLTGDGWYDPDGAQGQKFTTVDQINNARLDTLDNQLIVAYWMMGTTKPSASEYLMQFGESGGGNGGYWYIRAVMTSGVTRSFIQGQDTSAIGTKNSADLFGSGIHSVIHVLDAASGNSRIFVDGVESGSPVGWSDAADNLPDNTSDRGLSTFSHFTGGSNYDLQLSDVDAVTASDIEINNLLIMRSSTNLASVLGDMAADWHNSPREIPRGWDGL